jgi:signal peptidase II
MDRRRLVPVLAATAALVLTTDQVTKALVVAKLTPNTPVSLIDGWLRLRLVRNPGAAFSLLTGTTWLFTVIAVLVAVVIVRTASRIGSLAWALALGLIFGGLLGNLVDRLARAPGFGRGHVVDFIEYQRFPFMDFPVFNVADSAIVTGACLIALLGVLNIPLEGRRSADTEESAAS